MPSENGRSSGTGPARSPSCGRPTAPPVRRSRRDSLYAEVAAELGVVGLVAPGYRPSRHGDPPVDSVSAGAARASGSGRRPVRAVARPCRDRLGLGGPRCHVAGIRPGRCCSSAPARRQPRPGAWSNPARGLGAGVPCSVRCAPADGALSVRPQPERPCFQAGKLPKDDRCRPPVGESDGELWPEPFQMLSFCDARLGLNPLSVRMAQQATRKDPDNWEFQYSLAIVTAAAGRDPRPALSRARRLDPEQPLVRQAQRAFRTDRPETWKRRALRTPLPLQD